MIVGVREAVVINSCLHHPSHNEYIDGVKDNYNNGFITDGYKPSIYPGVSIFPGILRELLIFCQQGAFETYRLALLYCYGLCFFFN